MTDPDRNLGRNLDRISIRLIFVLALTVLLLNVPFSSFTDNLPITGADFIVV